MTGVRTRISALALVGAILMAGANPLLGPEQLRAACAARAHACGRTPRLITCCCGDGGSLVATTPGLVALREQRLIAASAMAVVFDHLCAPAAVVPLTASGASPPGAAVPSDVGRPSCNLRL